MLAHVVLADGERTCQLNVRTVVDSLNDTEPVKIQIAQCDGNFLGLGSFHHDRISLGMTVDVQVQIV